MDQTKNNALDRFLDAVARALAERNNPQGLFARLQGWLRKGLWGATVAYAVGLVLWLAALEWYGERHWLLSFCLFIPPLTWLSPLIVLSPLCWLVRRRLCWTHLGCALLLIVAYMDIEWSWWPTPKGPVVTVMTNNVGESGGTSFHQFAESESPDIIALQDAFGRGAAYTKSYTNYFMAVQEEFILLSKFPIKNSGLVEKAKWERGPVAAWFELDRAGAPLVVYSVHMPSPRHELESMRGLGLLAALFGREGRYGSKIRKSAELSWAARVDLAQTVVDEIGKEKRPFLIAGDFNVPSHGHIYHMVSSRFTDSFEKRGRGFGFTFPGYTHNPLALFGPWMRLDYIFAGSGLRPVYCRAEPDRRSQHRAVVARLEMVDSPPAPGKTSP